MEIVGILHAPCSESPMRTQGCQVKQPSRRDAAGEGINRGKYNRNIYTTRQILNKDDRAPELPDGIRIKPRENNT